MTRTRQQTVSMTMWALIVSASIAHGQTPTSRTADRSEHQITNLLAQARPQKRVPFSLMSSFNITPMAAGPNLTVLGGGTLGRLTKWTGFTSSNSFIGDSTIFEDKLGNVGIGTDSPTARLTVNGLIQSLNGGLKFPDGTVQTSSAAGALFSVAHDATLTGNGTQASPLSAAPLVSAITGEPFHQQIDVPVPLNSLSGEATVVVGSKQMVIEYVFSILRTALAGFPPG